MYDDYILCRLIVRRDRETLSLNAERNRYTPVLPRSVAGARFLFFARAECVCVSVLNVLVAPVTHTRRRQLLRRPFTKERRFHSSRWQRVSARFRRKNVRAARANRSGTFAVYSKRTDRDRTGGVENYDTMSANKTRLENVGRFLTVRTRRIL